ncbi:unnamed protein product [Trichogramma brassicae]|uniref:Replication protein A OB domain-containing protein n=1 Tax=Trichogramma brassicae TaxID=86971 RepID=A0A6H5J1M2_9HYME|nr:unnamed protein product [Trichogramma brassicae]
MDDTAAATESVDRGHKRLGYGADKLVRHRLGLELEDLRSLGWRFRVFHIAPLARAKRADRTIPRQFTQYYIYTHACSSKSTFMHIEQYTCANSRQHLNCNYQFRNFKVIDANNKYNNLKNDYEFLFTNDTILNLYKNEIIYTLKPIPFTELKNIVNLPTNTIINTIGIVLSIGLRMTIFSKSTNKEFVKKECTLIDDENTKINCLKHQFHIFMVYTYTNIVCTATPSWHTKRWSQLLIIPRRERKNLRTYCTERKDARPEPPPSTIAFQDYVAATKELQIHQRILLHLADRRLRSYLRAAPMPPPSPKRSAPASTPQSAAQPADPSGSPPPVWRLIRLDTPPPPQKLRLDPRLLPTDPRRYRASLNGAQTPPLPEEIEREQRRKATHHQLALFLAKHPQPVSSAPKKPAPTKLSLLRKHSESILRGTTLKQMASKFFADSKKRHRTFQKRREAIKYWQFWLIGRRFEVYSDHKPLENLNIKARTDEELVLCLRKSFKKINRQNLKLLQSPALPAPTTPSVTWSMHSVNLVITI